MSSSALAAGLRHLRTKLAAQQHHDDSDEQLLHAFTSRRDDSAFAVLVRRHGPMVLHVCRRVLGHEQDAEDAFQATFLVLSRQAAKLRKKTSLASWLYGTAHRIALKAKQAAARRRRHESQAPLRPNAEPSTELLWDDMRALLDNEIARLPEKYRSVFVLFYLEDIGREETARRLGLKEGTVASRLAEARQRLQRRLTRRGVELTAVLAASALAIPKTSALSPALIASTTEAALGKGAAGLVSAPVAALVKSAVSAAMVGKTKTTAVVLLAVSLLGAAGVLFRALPQVSIAPLSPPAANTDDKPHAVSPTPEAAKAVEIQGRVLDPDGRPVRGAKLLFLWWLKELPHKVWATSGTDGRFAFTVARSPAANSGWEMRGERFYVVAAAEGYGFAAAPLDNPQTAANLTLRL
ncbi:MAG TPA: sigma-70 family RNA polymerase sigma factor, partial [Gemmataceae bacterium]|nr:sigma-70 family RNA polymerase sigma factor [Gemmataceae bacterium]